MCEQLNFVYSSTCRDYTAEQEFQEHLHSLKVKLEDGTTRPMVERGGRDSSGKWIYLCYPCAAVCSGESILQTHISGKKHKTKLASTNLWPTKLFEEHPYHQNRPVAMDNKVVVQKMVQEVDIQNHNISELDRLFGKYKEVPCHLQESLDNVKAPLIGLEYLIEHPPEQEHYEPKYICTLCSKQGHPRTIINHMTCFWHRYNFILRHFPKACSLLTPYRSQTKYREGVGIVINRLTQRIEDKYGRMRPVNIDKEEFEKNKELIHQWIFKGHHFAEREGCTLEEVVDIGLIDSLHQADSRERPKNRKEPSPPIVAAPAKPHFNHFSRPVGRQERRAGSVESLSDISDEEAEARRDAAKSDRPSKETSDRRANSPFRHRYTHKSTASTAAKTQDKTRAPNYEYKVKLAADKRAAAEEFARKTLAYHEKNPEKHPLYPEEWKKFWNKRYKEIQAEGKDPSKHDFKPEWILFWTARMKVLHDEELRVTVNEIYRKMCLSPPDMTRKSPERVVSPPRRAPESRRRSPLDKRRRSPDRRHRSPPPRRRSPDPRRRSPDLRRRSPLPRRRSPDSRHRSPPRRRSPDIRRDRRSPIRRSPERRSIDRRRESPIRRILSRSRSPIRSRASPMRPRIQLESSARRSCSPLSQRGMQPRNRSPDHVREVAPSMQTVLISDDELKPDDGLSPWNSDNDIASVESVGSPRSRAGSVAPRVRSRVRRSGRASWRGGGGAGGDHDHAAPDDVVATLRLLVALEDYLGSLGPKLVDLLGEALKMEKEKPNSSEELLMRESCVVLLETAKEKLKGAAQAGLVAGSAAAAARAAVVRAAATLHEADKRAKNKKSSTSSVTTKSAVPVAGVGEVDRAQIAQQMAEALIAQGKTDVSSEELAQLVEAVVGMAEAKKREAERRQPASRPQVTLSAELNKAKGTASALQMLQSAYDENEKKIEKDEAPDAMDGLSDSDLETLLKNFNELSAEEQHSLIAYLKKLEAREPARVERLRQYVSEAAPPAAAPTAPPAALTVPLTAPAQPPRVEPAKPVAVVLESDDDDYTVEEVFQSATKKVKEDQMRQEMEIVKKSLEELQPTSTNQSTSPAVPAAVTNISAIVDVTRQLSSASDLFALVQASIKSTAAPTPAPIVQPPEVVASSTHPRSFGDLPDSPMVSLEPPKQTGSPIPLMPLGVPVNNQPAPLLRNPPPNFIDNRNNQPSPHDHFQGNQPQNDRFNQSNQPQNDRFNQGNQPQNDRFNQGNQPQNDRFNQGNQPQNDRFIQSNQPQNDRFNQSNQSQIDRFNQGTQPQNDRFNQGTQPLNDRFNQGNQPQNDRFNQGSQPLNNRFNQNNQPQDRFVPGNQPTNDRFNQGNQPQNERFNQGNPAPSERFNQQSNDSFNQGNQQQHDHFNQGNQQQHEQFNQVNPPPNQGNQWNIRPNVNLDNRTQPARQFPPNNQGSLLGDFNSGGQNNQAPRPNFMNLRGQDNFGNRPMNQQFGNYDNQTNFRGRGARGHFGAHNIRGRGRGYY